MTSSTRDVFVSAAESVAVLLREPAVGAAWGRPSVLPEFRVSGLAGHLARQVLSVPRVVAAPPPERAPISLAEHYAGSQWVGADLDSETNVVIRASGEETAAGGPAGLAAGVAAAVESLPAVFAGEPADRVVWLPWTSWALTLDDFLITRMMEIAVHSDDLAVSVGVETPVLAEPVFEAAVALLVRLSALRYGQPAVLRALSRAERAPITIAAI